MNSKSLKILVDETSDGLDIKLQNAGYYAESVKKLRINDEKMGHDYNVIQYAKENNMVFITKDKEPGKACKANGIPCIWLSDDILFEKIILPELEKLNKK
jgi:predicted nuclease of predicted toxin-antitoxin system